MRLRADMKLRSLAARAEITPGYLSKIERGVQTAPPATMSRLYHEIGRYRAEKASAA